jgi:hypothetical protein
MSDEEWGSKQIELLYGAVLDEMQWKNAFGELGLPDETLHMLARAVTIRVDYAFAVTWSPNWVSPGRPHTWADDDGWHARCNQCLAESPASRTEGEVEAWFDDHVEKQRAAHE